LTAFLAKIRCRSIVMMTAWAMHVRHSGRIPEMFSRICRHCATVLLSVQDTFLFPDRIIFIM
jgi:hypothetical protein